MSGFLVYGDIRDLTEDVHQGDGVDGILHFVSLVPAYGDYESVITKLAKLGSHIDDKVKVLSLLLKNSDIGNDIELATRAVRSVHGDDLIDTLKNEHHITDSVLVQLAKKSINLERVKLLKETVYDGTWTKGYSEGEEFVGELNFMAHYDKHVTFEPGNWGPISPSEYLQKAIDLINQADGVEKYIQVRGQQVKLVVYNRQTEECAIGTLNGEIATLHIRPAHIDEKLNGIDDLIEKGEILRIN